MLAHLLCEKTSKLARVNNDYMYMYVDFYYSSDMYLYEECVPGFKLDAENRRIDGVLHIEIAIRDHIIFFCAKLQQADEKIFLKIELLTPP